MLLKFLKNGKTYECENIEYIDAQKIKVTGKDIPSLDGGFDVINNEIVDNMYNKYVTFYKKNNKDLIFTTDINTYYTYLLFDEVTGYVCSQITTTDNNVTNGILQESGKTEEFVYPAIKVLVDEDGFYLYKAVDGKIVDTTAADKKAWMDEKAKEDYIKALEAKLNEISAASKAAIVGGIDLNGSHYSYETEDQNNISNAVTLANQTKLAVPYHADGESCRLYEPDEITSIYVLEETNLTHNVTYHNQLKLYIQSLTTKAEIEEVKYGETKLTGEYLDTYNMIMAQAQEVIRHFIGQN